MVRFAALPTTRLHAEHVTVSVPLLGGTDPAWRNLFNRLAEERGLNAEAMGNFADAEIVVRLPRHTSYEATKTALDRTLEICDATDAGLDDYREAEVGVAAGVAAWWLCLQTGSRSGLTPF